MKNPLVAKKADAKIQEIQTVVLIALCVAVLVLAAVVAVLLAQGNSHRKSIDALNKAVTELQAAN